MISSALVPLLASAGRGIIDLSGSREFLSKFTTLYLDSFMANVVIGLLLGALGLFVILRRMVFLSAALSQVAGTGLAFAFFLGAITAHQGPGSRSMPVVAVQADEVLDQQKPKTSDDQDIKDFLDDVPGMAAGDSPAAPAPTRGASSLPAPSPALAAMTPPRPRPTVSPPVAEAGPQAQHGQHTPINPLVLSLLVTIAVALLLSMDGSGRFRATQESVVGLVFIVASAATIVFAQLAEKGAHEIAEFLFGTVIFIPPDQQKLIYISAAGIFVVYAWLFKDFVFVSFDPVSARASGFPVGLANGVLFLLIALGIGLCTRAVGAMPVFALTVLPPVAALQIQSRMVPSVLTSALLGGLSAAGGYFLSGLLNLSAGPLIVCLAASFVVLAWSGRWIVTLVTARRLARAARETPAPSTQ
jgi:zinc transport system permease protein